MATATVAAAYRPLNDSDIATLLAAGCQAENWRAIDVAENFNPHALRNVTFSGRVRLGAFRDAVTFPGGVELPSGVRNAALHNCHVGHNSLVQNVGRHIANYHIGDDVVIVNVGVLATEGRTSFGNGVRVKSLNEAGGRETPIFDRLSCQMAYLMSLRRDRPEVVRRLEAIACAYAESLASDHGEIGDGAWITDCPTLTDLRVGPAARIDGALRLSEGTVHSNPEAPSRIGAGVIAERFIACTGSRIDGGVGLSDTFIGQGVRLGRQFSAEHSLFFANSEGLHGEACSMFAGPYTVTHHKASLLIAGMTSFFNAGSGTNQSNHMYKLGPVHQGVLERGAKTGSHCYLVWPSRVGAFTTVIGRHQRKLDTSLFPFSYLLEDSVGSVLIPAVNFATVGTRRDVAKWRQRDRRTDSDKLDLLHFDALSPYTVSRMIRARRLLAGLDTAVAPSQEYVDFAGAKIPRARLHKSASAYDMAVQFYLGAKISARLALLREAGVPRERMIGQLLESNLRGRGEWVDLCGLLAPAGEVQKLLDSLAVGDVDDLPSLEAELSQLHAGYEAFEWDWVAAAWLTELGKKPAQVTPQDVARAVTQWRSATLQCNQLVLRDAESEFGQASRIGYGIDGAAGAGRERLCRGAGGVRTRRVRGRRAARIE